MLRYVPLIGILLANQPAYAVQQPLWQEYRVYSPDREASFRADIVCTDNCDLPFEEQTYSIVVRRTDTNDVEWSCLYDYRGDRGGVLSEDGWVFVDVDPWFRGELEPVVHIYRKGIKTFELTAQYLGITRPARSRGSNTAYAWLQSYRLIRGSQMPVLEVSTVDGLTLKINCLDGYIIKE